MIPETYQDLLTEPVVVTLVTIMPDGQPQATPVWCSFDGEMIWVNTAAGRQKDKNMQANPKVTVLAIDPQDPYRWLEVRGEVAERITEGAVEHIDALTQTYTGAAHYYGGYAPAERAATEQRVIYKIQPRKVNP